MRAHCKAPPLNATHSLPTYSLLMLVLARGRRCRRAVCDPPAATRAEPARFLRKDRNAGPEPTRGRAARFNNQRLALGRCRMDRRCRTVRRLPSFSYPYMAGRRINMCALHIEPPNHDCSRQTAKPPVPGCLWINLAAACARRYILCSARDLASTRSTSLLIEREWGA